MVDIHELDPRNKTDRLRATVPIYTEQAVDIMIGKGFVWGACFGFVMGLIAAALFFLTGW